jgi:membrane protein required for colicin V production
MSVADFNWFDWILVAIVLFSMVMAFRRGFVRALFGMLGFIGGFVLATWNYATFGDWINDSRLVVAPSTARIIAFLLIVVAVAAAFELAGLLLQKTLRAIGLSFLDRFLGMGFGFARGCLVGIGLLMATTTFAPQSKAVTASVLSPYLFAVSHDVSFLVPQYLQRVMLAGAFNLQQNPPHWINWH